LIKDYIIYIPQALVGLFFFAVAIQLFYYLYFYSRIAFHKPNKLTNDVEPVSIIICAKNESENLEKFLPLVLDQDFQYFEVIVVNDCSMDDTEMHLAQMRQKYPKLRFTTITEDEKFKHGKKLAVTVGIKSAKHNNIVFIDADCYPETKRWLYSMQQGFGWGKEIVLGYGGYEERKGFLNKFIRFDCMFVAINYLSFAKAHIPYMGIGRNLAYKKTLFFKNKGFATHYELNSGDDDLFVNETSTKKNTIVVLDNDSIVRTVPKMTFGELYLQKKRHLTTSDRYKYKHQFLLTFEPFTRFLYYILVAPVIILTPEPLKWYIVGFAVLRLLVQLIIIKLSMIKLKEKKLLLYSPLLDILLPLFYLYIHIVNYFTSDKKQHKWK
jgi:poly-beta-1,6-N-acetyl-D-glucosamine synthase